METGQIIGIIVVVLLAIFIITAIARSVRIVPEGPDRTRLIAEWYFAPETLAQPGFDAAKVVDFAKIVLGQDGAAAEMNQRGIRSPAFTAARLMPEEYEIHRFHQWVLAEMEARE